MFKSLGDDPARYKQDAQRLESLAERLSGQELLSWLDRSTSFEDTADLQASLGAIASNPQFKYSRLFAIGLFSLLEKADPDLVKDQETRNNAIAKVSAALHLPEDKVSKDLDLYRSNLEKMTQARIVLQDVIQAERKNAKSEKQKLPPAPQQTLLTATINRLKEEGSSATDSVTEVTDVRKKAFRLREQETRKSFLFHKKNS